MCMGGSSRAPCLCGSKSLGGHGQRRHGAGRGPVASARWKSHTLTGAARWKPCGFASCPLARWPSQRRWPPAPPKPRKPSASPSPASAWPLVGLPGRRMPRRPSVPLQAVGRDGGAANRPSGALLRSTIVSKRFARPKSARVEAVRRRRRPLRAQSASVGSCPQRLWGPPKRRRGGRAWPQRGGRRCVRMSSYSRPIRRHISP